MMLFEEVQEAVETLKGGPLPVVSSSFRALKLKEHILLLDPMLTGEALLNVFYRLKSAISNVFQSVARRTQFSCLCTINNRYISIR